MKIKFCGAARTVTGSAHLITLLDGYKILLDCGLNQGRGKEVWNFNNRWEFDPADVDCVILSHAHIDHAGRIPQLVKDGFDGALHCTHATRSLCSIMLLDSAYIQEKDVDYYNRKLLRKKKGGQLRRPLYTTADVPDALNKFCTHGYNKWFKIHPMVEVRFQDAGHILGSASVSLRIKEGKKYIHFGFTGDIGRPERPILRDPLPMPEMDYIICESTYGDKTHESIPEQSNRFLDIIKDTCIKKKGKLIIPAFSVGRTQEIVYMLDKLESSGKLPKIPVYVDSPLAVDATTVYMAHPECYDKALCDYLQIDDNPFGFKMLTYVKGVEQSKALNDNKEPMIIISSAGMMNAGRVKHHLYNNVENPKNTFLIVGYCSPETPGGQLRNGNKQITIFGDRLEVKANIKMMDSFSAHGDKKEMHEFLKNQTESCKKVFLVHGEIDTQQKFKQYLEQKNFKDVEIPELGQEYTLD
jgi:metallo-beta-lactamase family protein